MSLPLNTQALQIIDRWLGMPACAALSLFRKIADLFSSPQIGPVQPKKILFVKFAEQGSTVLAFPAIARAIEMVGRENVWFVVFEENRFILDLMQLIPEENVITIRHNGVVDMVNQALGALAKIRSLGIDAAVDMEFFSRSSAALTFLTGARMRAGLHTFFGDGPYRGDLLTHRLLYNPYHHTSQIFLQMIEALAMDPKTLPTQSAPAPAIEKWLPEVSARPADQAEVRAIVRRELAAVGYTVGESLPPIVLLNPNASDLLPLRKWPTDRYVQTARQLFARFPDICIGLTGGPSEAPSAERVAAEIGDRRCVSLAGKTSLGQLLTLYSICELLVTNDSGPAHFASMTGISVVTLFGPETPSLFGARSPRNTALWAGLACSPCVNAYNNRQSPCRNNLCMQHITVEQVVEAASAALEARLSRTGPVAAV